MTRALDPEIAEVLAPVLGQLATMEPPPPGDVAARRELVGGLMATFMATLPDAPPVDVQDDTCVGHGGATVPLRVYRPTSATGGLVLYVHGGGMILGSVELYDPLLRFLAGSSGSTLVAVDYRLAPEHPHPTPVEDAYAALVWAAENATSIGCEPGRLGVAGDSAGGGNRRRCRAPGP